MFSVFTGCLARNDLVFNMKFLVKGQFMIKSFELTLILNKVVSWPFSF